MANKKMTKILMNVQLADIDGQGKWEKYAKYK